MIANDRRNVLEKWMDESNAKEPTVKEKTSAQVYRRVAIERHRTWVAVASTGATLMLTVPAISQQVSTYSSLLMSWIGHP